mgnify:CR=1 FL=1
MKRLHFSSFRQRLNAAFLAVSLVPMLLCSGLLLQIFRLRMTSNAQQTAQQQLSASCEALDTLHSGFLQTAASLQHDPLVAQALFDAEAEDAAVYSQLFGATESLRSIRHQRPLALFDAGRARTPVAADKLGPFI